MNRYLLDTNHAGALFRKVPVVSRRLSSAGDATACLCPPVVGELWFMVFNSTRVDQNRADLREFLGQFDRVPFNSRAAVEFGRMKAELRRIGRPIPDIDLQIAAIAVANDLALLTDDAHFDCVAGLKHDNWLR